MSVSHPHSLTLFIVILVIHLMGIQFYDIPFPNPNRVKPIPATSPVYMVAGTPLDDDLRGNPWAQDPLLLARANEHGFTGVVWQGTHRSPNPYLDWEAPMQFLTRSQYVAGERMIAVLQARLDADYPALTRSLPDLREEGLLGKRMPPQRSILSVVGELAGRKLEPLPQLPALALEGQVPPTSVEIGVDRLGYVVSRRLLRSVSEPSKISEREALALRTVASLRFRAESDEAADRTWGRVIFSWAMSKPGELTVPSREP